MATAAARSLGIGHNRGRSRSMYAITFDLDMDTLKAAYPGPSYTNAYSDIRRVLDSHGFDWVQGSVYFGNDAVTPVTCVLAVLDMKAKHPWFASSVRDMRMLRIEDNNDLMPIIQGAEKA
jgi:virulence-associated protein VapD